MTHFDFLGKAKYAAVLSSLLMVGSIVAILTVGLRPGVDFTGGLQLTLFYPPGTVLPNDVVRSHVAPLLSGTSPAPTLIIQSVEGQRDLPGLGPSSVPGKIVTVQGASAEQEESLRMAIIEPDPDSTLPQPIEYSITQIGAQVSKEIVARAIEAVLVALGAMLIYIAWRFRLRYGVAGVLALFHDVLITLGVFSVAQVSIDLPVIAAFLTVVGYSINDTIIVFDRIRENVKAAKKAPLWDNMNRAINQTITRTLNTAGTTLVPIIILFVVGGAALRGFALAMLMGVTVGTYSSIFVATPIAYAWSQASERRRKRR